MARVPTLAIVGALWLVWSTTLIAIKLGLAYASPLTFAALRTLVTVVVLMIGFRAMRRAQPFWGSTRDAHRLGALLGLFNVVLFLLLQNIGFEVAGAGFGAIILYTQPLMVAFAASVFLGERLSARQLGGLLIGWVGVGALVISQVGRGDLVPWAVVALLGAAAAWSAGTILFKGAAQQVPIWRLLLLQNCYGLVPLSVAALASGGTVAISGVLAASVVWAGLAGGVAGLGLQFVLLRRGQASVVSTYIFAVPIMTALMGVAFLGEAAHMGLAWGAALVSVGIYLVSSDIAPLPQE